MEPLVAEGIPCVRIYPAEEIVQEQVYHLQILDLSARENQGKLAVIAIRFDYTFDSEQDLFIREWEKMQYQNEFREQVYAAAQRMEAAVFGDGLNHFFILTTRSMLMNAFLKSKEHWKLLRFGQRSPEFRVWMGIGIGSAMLVAKSRATMALNHAVREHSGTSFLADSENQSLTPLDTGAPPPQEQAAEFFARKIQVSTETLGKIRQCLRTQGDTLTSDQLARGMGITERSVNRIIARLEEAGCVTVVGKHSAGKGRPARVMKIALPESLRWDEMENPFSRGE